MEKLELFYTVAVWTHIAAGFLTLPLFWAQLLLRKGGARHVLVGRLFVVLGFVVALSALWSIGYQVAGEIVRGAQEAEQETARAEDYLFAVLLAFISIEVLVMLGRGRFAARQSRSVSKLPANGTARILSWLRALGSLAASVGLLAYAVLARSDASLFLLLAVAVGAKITADEIHVAKLMDSFSANDWIAEHFRGMIGAGIAFHAAFGVFGMFRLADRFGIDPSVGVVLAVVPALVGITAETVLRRRFKARANL